MGLNELGSLPEILSYWILLTRNPKPSTNVGQIQQEINGHFTHQAFEILTSKWNLKINFYLAKYILRLHNKDQPVNYVSGSNPFLFWESYGTRKYTCRQKSESHNIEVCGTYNTTVL
jgi:hypothetical protein